MAARGEGNWASPARECETITKCCSLRFEIPSLSSVLDLFGKICPTCVYTCTDEMHKSTRRDGFVNEWMDWMDSMWMSGWMDSCGSGDAM